MAAVRISLPSEMADALVDDAVAIRPFTLRGNAGDVWQLLVNGVNTGASTVTLIVATNTLRKLAQRIWERLGDDDSKEEIIVSLTLPGEEHPKALKIQRDDAAAQDKILDFLAGTLPDDVA